MIGKTPFKIGDDKMLLRFGVSNFKSIKDYQEISLIASGYKENLEFIIQKENLKEKVIPVRRSSMNCGGGTTPSPSAAHPWAAGPTWRG